jgi:glucokinase
MSDSEARNLTGVVVGVDIGGTKIAAAAVDADGRLAGLAAVPTAAERGPADGLRRLAALIESAAGAAHESLLGIGIGCTGPLDTERGIVRNPYTLPTWDGMELAAPLSARFGVPVALLNDCDAAALGEAWIGAGRGFARIAYVTIGTGIGAGIVIGGRLLEAPGGLAGEIGHATIDLRGPPCYCGSTGCLEQFAAGPVIERAVRAAGGPGWSALQEFAGAGRPVTAAVIVEAARAGVASARAELERAAWALGVGLANLALTIAPERIIVGGGLSGAWDILGPIVTETFAKRTQLIAQIGAQILLSALPNAAVVGAAHYVWDSMASNKMIGDR